jgi:hypothetical protein
MRYTAHLLEWLIPTKQHQMLVRIQSNRNCHPLLMGMKMVHSLGNVVWVFLANLEVDFLHKAEAPCLK